MLTIGDKFPDFSVTGVVSTDPKTAFQPFDQKSDKGKWKLVFFWPKDFTFVCPTEIIAFSAKAAEFRKLGAELLGVSVATVERDLALARAWLASQMK